MLNILLEKNNWHRDKCTVMIHENAELFSQMRESLFERCGVPTQEKHQSLTHCCLGDFSEILDEYFSSQLQRSMA